MNGEESFARADLPISRRGATFSGNSSSTLASYKRPALFLLGRAQISSPREKLLSTALQIWLRVKHIQLCDFSFDVTSIWVLVNYAVDKKLQEGNNIFILLDAY